MKRRATRGKTGSGGEAGKLIAGFVLGVAVAVGGVYLYQHTGGHGDGRQAVVEPERSAARTVRRQEGADRAAGQSPEMPAATAGAGSKRVAPFGTSEEVFEAGARAYADQCAGCHGRPGRQSVAAPAAGGVTPQFWDGKDAVTKRLVQRPAGEIFASIAMGSPARGMPAYEHRIAETEMWDLALLLKSARGELPDPVLSLLRGGQ